MSRVTACWRQQLRVLKEKLDDYWRGPLSHHKTPEDSIIYYLEELDWTTLAKTTAGNRLKKLFPGHLMNTINYMRL
jgi:hypothetical protein